MGNIKNTGRAMTVPSGLAVGATVSMTTTIVIAFLGAQMVMNGILSQEQIGYCSLAALLASTILGAITACNRIKTRKLFVCILSGCIYLSVLLATTALFFGGQYQGFGVTAATVLIGCVAAMLLTDRLGNSRPKHRRKK